MRKKKNFLDSKSAVYSSIRKKKKKSSLGEKKEKNTLTDEQ